MTKDVLFFQVDLSETGIYTYINIYISIYIHTCIPNAVEWMIIKWAMASQSVSHNQRVYPQDMSEGKKGTSAPSRKVGYWKSMVHGCLGSMSNHLFFG